MANPIHRTNIVTKDKRSQRKVADSTTELAKTEAMAVMMSAEGALEALKVSAQSAAADDGSR